MNWGKIAADKTDNTTGRSKSKGISEKKGT